MTSKFRKLALSLAIAAQVLVAPSAWGAIPRTDRGVDFSKIITPIESLRVITADDVARFIPSSGLEPTGDSGAVATRILDHSISSILQSPELRRSAVGRSVQKVEAVIEPNISFGGAEKGSVKHTVRVKMAAIQSKAQIEYQGYMKAQLSFDVSKERLDLDITQKISDNTDLLVAHQQLANGSTDMVSLRWNF